MNWWCSLWKITHFSNPCSVKARGYLLPPVWTKTRSGVAGLDVEWDDVVARSRKRC